MKSAAEQANEIRAELKKRGWSSREVSVRAKTFRCGSSIDVTIKVGGIRKAAVEAIASRAESIRRCERTGEILSGGNRYVSVEFDWQLSSAATKALLQQVEALPVHRSHLHEVTVGRDHFLVGRYAEHAYGMFRSNNMSIPAGNAHSVASILAGSALEQCGKVIFHETPAWFSDLFA